MPSRAAPHRRLARRAGARLARLATFVAGLGLAASTLGCTAKPAKVSDRVWVSTLPREAKQPFFALLISGPPGREVGVVHRGSMYKGQWDLFRWRARGEGEAEVEFLHDGARHIVRIEACTPAPGFDHCLRLEGDPTGVGTWYSKKRWALRRKDRRESSDVAALQGALLDPLIAELGVSELHDRED